MRTHRAEGALGILLAALACPPALATDSNEGSGALARVTSRVFDLLGRLAAIQGAAGQTTTLQYDANGRVSGIVDPLNQRTAWTSMRWDVSREHAFPTERVPRSSGIRSTS